MITHIFTDYTPRDPETLRRMTIAQATWKRQPWTEFGVRDDQLPRLWPEADRQFAYVRDLFDLAALASSPADILVYTNADILVRGDCCALIAAVLQSGTACYAFRRDFGRLEAAPQDTDFVRGRLYAGSDLYAFRVSWWQSNRDKMPDMLLGMEMWDACLRVLIEETNLGRMVSIPDVICHERHGSFWEHPNNRYKLRAQHHCLSAGCRFMRKMGKNPENFGVPSHYLLQHKL